jgi:uncharacterized membrane protein
MGHLATAFIVAVLVVNLAALALVGYRLTGHYALSRATSPIAAALALFFVEHFVGLGRLGWSWPLTTALSLWVISRGRHVLRAHWRVEAAFLGAFAWAFAWRFASPGIVASSEKIGDLAMISTYLPGSRLPATDAWFPPYPFDVYYSFQHYAAGLLGRLLALGPGFTYNVAFCVAIALTLTAVAAAAWTVCRSTRATALVTAAFALGGTGATIPAHLMATSAQLYSSMRFIGDAATPGQVQTAFGRALVARAQVPVGEVPKLPSETFAYLTALGDYHPPLSGFYLLAVGLLCIVLLEREGVGRRTARAAAALLAATLPLCAIANGWTLPLQGLLVATWIASRVLRRRLDWRAVDWPALGVGLVGAAALCYPFLSTFGYRAADYDVHLRLVPAGAHTPPLLGAIVLAPTLAAIVLPLALGERRRILRWISALWLALLVVTELFFVDDVYSGTFERFNTTLKWWPWIQAGALLTAGAYGLRSASRALRVATVAVLALVLAYGVDLGRALFTGPKPDLGQLDGAGTITADPIERALLAYLQARPRGIVLQRLQAGAFTPAPALVLLAGQTAFLGWPEPEKLWRGQRADVALRDAEVRRFYAGEQPDAAAWLTANRIDHVLWLRTESELPPGTFDRVDQQIRGAYLWREYFRVDEFRVGVWSRK